MLPLPLPLPHLLMLSSIDSMSLNSQLFSCVCVPLSPFCLPSFLLSVSFSACLCVCFKCLFPSFHRSFSPNDEEEVVWCGVSQCLIYLPLICDYYTCHHRHCHYHRIHHNILFGFLLIIEVITIIIAIFVVVVQCALNTPTYACCCGGVGRSDKSVTYYAVGTWPEPPPPPFFPALCFCSWTEKQQQPNRTSSFGVAERRPREERPFSRVPLSS